MSACRWHLSVWGALVCGLLASVGNAAEWKPAEGPLLTRWAKDVRPDRVLPDYPRPQMRRSQWLNLNGLWQLAIATEKEEPPLGKDLPERILVPFPVESALSGVMKRAERLWYRRTFTVPKEWSGQRLLLHFGAVDWEANVWVNGKKVATHRGGYDAFTCDITPAVLGDDENELVVGVWDPSDGGTQPRGKQVNKPGGIYYTPTTGIWQTVWLEPVPRASIETLTIVPDVDGGRVLVTVHGRGTGARDRVEISLIGRELGDVRAGDGRSGGRPEPAVEGITTAKGPPGKAIELPIPKEKRELWSPESPFLYGVRVDLYQDGDKGVDTVFSYCGLRKIEVKDDDGVKRMFLNGKPYFQVGPLDQGFWPDGLYTAPTDEALKFDIEITKKLGFNMTRKHVKVEPERWYYWCDKLGLLVWQDMPSGDRGIGGNDPDLVRTPESAAQYDRELKAMIDGLHNHPSVVMWVVFNEGWGQFDTKRVTEWTKKYDPTRLVDCASGWTDRGVGDVHDIHVYPGPGAPPPEKDRAGVLGEFGGLGLGVDGHTWASKNWSYQGTSSRTQLTRRYEQLLRHVHRLKEERGLAAAVYTQITDVETEINGLLTYDRAVVKVDADRVAAANAGDFSRAPDLVPVIPTSQREGFVWRYTFEKPADDWYKPGFDASGWKEGPGGFGTKGTPGAVVRTEWSSADIWLRREIGLPETLPDDLIFLMHHDEDAEVYINGVLAAKVGGFTTDYEEVPISKEAREVLKPGRNVIAIHCHQTTGGQFIDLGLAAVRPKKTEEKK